MENGEKAVLCLQFGVLFLVVLVIGNFLPSSAPQTGPAFSGVYWGRTKSANKISQGATFQSSTNASSIIAYFHLAPSTTLTSISASRFCMDHLSGNGESRSFATITLAYDQARSENYMMITPTGQSSGLSCTYGIQMTDSLGQVAKWTGSVLLKPSS